MSAGSRRWVLLGFITISAFSFLTLLPTPPMKSNANVFGRFPKFSLSPKFGHSTRKPPSRIYELAAFLRDEVPQAARAVFDRIYLVEPHRGKLKVPPAFEARVKSMFAAYPGGTQTLGFVEDQVVLTTYNKFTQDHSMFNEIRRYRPGYMEKLSSESESKLEEQMNGSRGESCDFCAGRVAEEVFGTFQGKHCYIASNVAKYEGYHGVVVAREHHPFKFTRAALEEYISLSYQWFQAVRNVDSTQSFPHFMWDAGPKASASQMHQHMQLIMTRERYLTRAEQSRLNAMKYELRYPNSNYWSDVAIAHDTVGLAVRYKDCALLSHVTPMKEREIIVICESGADPAFAALLHVGLRAMIDDVGTRAFSAGVTFEVMNPDQHQQHYPAVARVVDRGSPLDLRSDVGAMEFYGSYNVGADPYHIMPFLRARVKELK